MTDNEAFADALDYCSQLAGDGDDGWNERFRKACRDNHIEMQEGVTKPKDVLPENWIRAPMPYAGGDDGWPDDTVLIWQGKTA